MTRPSRALLLQHQVRVAGDAAGEGVGLAERPGEGQHGDGVGAAEAARRRRRPWCAACSPTGRAGPSCAADVVAVRCSCSAADAGAAGLRDARHQPARGAQLGDRQEQVGVGRQRRARSGRAPSRGRSPAASQARR